MHFGACTPLTRSWSSTIKILLMSLAGVGLSSYVLYAAFHGYPGIHVVLGGGLLLFLSLVGVWCAIDSYTGNCPNCGAPQKRVDGLHRCDNCLAYGERAGRQYCQIEANRVARQTVFAIRLPDEWEMPNLCCACGVPAVRFDSMRIVREEFAFDVGAPHCGLHSQGAQLTARYEKASNKNVPVLKVASYGFYREFLKRNGMARL